MVDIIAIQDIYGANTITRNTDLVYFSNSNVGGIFDFSQFNGPQAVTVYDTGGVDTLDTSDYNQNAPVTLVEIEFSSLGNEDNVTTIARGSVIENIISGNGADTLSENDASNEITGGGAGNDTTK